MAKKKKTKESNKVRAKDLIKDKLKEEKPVAKKIVLPEKKETRVPDVEDVFSDDDEEDTFSDEVMKELDSIPDTVDEKEIIVEDKDQLEEKK